MKNKTRKPYNKYNQPSDDISYLWQQNRLTGGGYKILGRQSSYTEIEHRWKKDKWMCIYLWKHKLSLYAFHRIAAHPPPRVLHSSVMCLLSSNSQSHRFVCSQSAAPGHQSSGLSSFLHPLEMSYAFNASPKNTMLVTFGHYPSIHVAHEMSFLHSLLPLSLKSLPHSIQTFPMTKFLILGFECFAPFFQLDLLWFLLTFKTINSCSSVLILGLTTISTHLSAMIFHTCFQSLCSVVSTCYQ